MKTLKIALYSTISIILIVLLFTVVLKPVLLNYYIKHSKEYSRGQFVCTLDKNNDHIGRLYKISNGEKKLIHQTKSNSCIFSRPKINAGFFIFAIGGGGGATPYASGNSGQIISKHIRINNPVIVINVGTGGKGTYISPENNEFKDAQDGTPTKINDLKIIAHGGSRSTRMTPTGTEENLPDYHIPEKYRYLYDISNSEKYGAGGKYNSHTKTTSAKAQDGHSGAVIIQW